MNYNPMGLFVERFATQRVWDMKDMHSHNSYELYYLISGHRRYLIGHRIYDVTPGDLVVIPRHRLHRTVSPRPVGYDRYVCNFFDDRLQPFIQTLGQETYDRFWDGGCLHLPPQTGQRIFSDLKQLDAEVRQPGPHSPALRLHLLQDILLSALLHGTPKEPVHGEGADKVQALAGFIASNYAEPITLHDAAAMACMEDTYFSKRFKALTGFGFQEYLIQTRLQAAEQLLVNTSLSVGEVAEQCGFSSANYFCDVFRRWKGVSPSRYRTGE